MIAMEKTLTTVMTMTIVRTDGHFGVFCPTLAVLPNLARVLI